MRPDGSLLVIGPTAVRDSVAAALPRCSVIAAPSALSGVWQSAQQPYDGVLVSLRVGKKALRAVRCIRDLRPALRIVVGAAPVDEPLAQQALELGASDYVIEPLLRTDLEQALSVLNEATLGPAPAALAPSAREITQLGEILRRVSDGMQPTVERLAALVREAFGAAAAAVQLDECMAISGEAGEWILGEAIQRHERTIGKVLLGRCLHGAYPAAGAARLAEYAQLIESVTAQTAAQERWRELAWTDDLTGLRNRRYFERAFDERLAYALENRSRVTLFSFDIDGFKGYNDRHGHDAGDALLREMSQLLLTCTREHDVVARLGGDEFAVVFWDAERPRVPGSQHPRDTLGLAERFARAIREHDFRFLGPEGPGPITISGGVACFPWHGHDRAALLRAADEALLSAKREGKNRIVLAGETIEPPAAQAG